MRTYIKMISLVIALTASSWLLPQKASAQSVSMQVFYDQLGPYGQWITYPDYGYVWIPDAGPNFFPYGTNGNWVYTDAGWSWYSNYVWGWAPFHYGRWDYDPLYGWFWIPDTEWGPAWVTWRNSPGYYGWEPMGVRSDIDDYYRCRFVRNTYFGRQDMYRYYATNNQTIYRNSTRYNGPNVVEVRHVTGRNFTPVTIYERDKPGQLMSNGKWNIYRPRVDKTGDAKPNPANYGGVKPASAIKTPPKTSPNPANYGGTKPGGTNTNTNPGTRTQPKSSPNPRNYGGATPGGTNTNGNSGTRTQPSQSPNPANYGGTRPAPVISQPAPVTRQPAPVKRTEQTPVIREPAPQREPAPSNYGGSRPSPSPSPAPVNRAPAPQPQQRAPNPANYGGARPGGPGK
ncbi:MAG: hypothetical protein JWN78_903 [Bacteroidota bacterium]|nr:hypothetical protein [Bacteroidota bacterium]